MQVEQSLLGHDLLLEFDHLFFTRVKLNDEVIDCVHVCFDTDDVLHLLQLLLERFILVS